MNKAHLASLVRHLKAVEDLKGKLEVDYDLEEAQRKLDGLEEEKRQKELADLKVMEEKLQKKRERLGLIEEQQEQE